MSSKRNTKLYRKPLNATEFNELTQVVKDVFYFAQFIYLIHPIRGKVKFDLYPFQKSVLWHFLTKRFNIVLKFRQAGVTELISMYCLWLCMYHPNKNVVIVSIKERVAKKVLRKIKYMYRNLPEHIKVPVVNGKGDDVGTATEMEFSNGSLITSIPTTEEAGRSEAVSLLVIDEAAIVRWANQIWAAAFPTLSTGGAAIVNSCITGDTEIIGRNGNFRVELVCPKELGVQDIRFMNLEVLTHKLQWKKVIYGLNKGNLETWEIGNEFGDIIKCTPAHKFLTPFGWRSAEDIINKNLYTIIYNHGTNGLQEPPITIPPKYEELKEIRGFPNYLISNLGKVYHKINQKEKESKPNKLGYRRIKLWANNKSKTFHLSNLVAEYFIGKIPEGYIVDHINCKTADDYVTNLQIITRIENAQRAIKFSRGLKLNTNTGKGASNLQLVGYIKYLYAVKNYPPDEVINKVERKFSKKINRAYISRVINNKRNNNTKLSRLVLNRKFSETIYDITVEGDESYISNSNYISHNTPYGVGNWFHQMWVDAFSGGNGFNPIRLRWQMHPERDMVWYKQMSDILGPRRTAQEIDGDFLTSGNSVFNLADIRAIEEEIGEFQYHSIEMNGSLYIVRPPAPGIEYYIGADVATGRARDYSTFTIMDRHGQEMACFKQKIEPGRFADLLVKMGTKYNRATIAPESNDIGMAVTTRIQDSGYRKLYYSTKFLREKGRNKPKEQAIPGWITSSKSRPLMISHLEEDIRLNNIDTKDPFFVQEAYTFIYDETNRPVAMGKGKREDEDDSLSGQSFTDDAIMGKAISNFVRKGKSTGPIILPK